MSAQQNYFAKILLSFLIASVISLFSPKTVFAVSVDVSSLPPTVDITQELEIDVNLVCNSCGDSYLRGVFFSSGTNYFGFTQNKQGDWIGTVSDKTQYLLVAKADLIESTWSGKLRVKPDSSDPNYHGPGPYLFKVARYTPSGSATWSSENQITITGPTPTPTPTPEPTNTPTPTPTTKTTSTPTSKPTPTPTPTQTKTPTPKPTLTPSSTAKILATAVSTVAAVLGETATSSATPGSVLSGEVASPADSSRSSSWLKILLILAILAVLAMVSSAFWIQRRKRDII